MEGKTMFNSIEGDSEVIVILLLVEGRGDHVLMDWAISWWTGVLYASKKALRCVWHQVFYQFKNSILAIFPFSFCYQELLALKFVLCSPLIPTS